MAVLNAAAFPNSIGRRIPMPDDKVADYVIRLVVRINVDAQKSELILMHKLGLQSMLLFFLDEKRLDIYLKI